MRHHQLVLIASILLTGTACDESNPYKDGNVQTGTTAPKSATQTGGTTPGANTGNPAAAEAPVAAKPETIAPAALNSLQLVCADQEAISKFKIEMDVLCLNGQPTAAFANAVATPFKGTGTAALTVVKSVDVAGISHFVLMSSIEVPKNMAGALANRQALNASNIVEGNATLVQSEAAVIPSKGGNDLGGFELTFNLKVNVAIITVNDDRVLTRDFVVVKEGAVVRSATVLKPGAPANAENLVANILSFWISDGTTTKLIGVTHQQADNRGQHPTAETTVLNLGRRTIVEGYTALAK